MHKFTLPSMVLSISLLTAPLTYADIVGMLENPAEGSVAGISLISGWAYSEDEEEDLTVYLRLDGVTLRESDIPCCGGREDVQREFPDAPEDTSFGVLFNFSELSPGPHIIGVDIRSSDVVDDIFNSEDRRIIEHPIFVVRPGNTPFLNSVDLSGATCSVSPVDNEVVLDNVGLTSATETTTTTLRSSFVSNSQSFVVSDSTDAPPLNSFVAHLNGSQEVPRIDTSATGEATVTLNADNTLTCLVTTTDLDDATAAHIHLGDFGTNGDITITLTGGPGTWSCPTTALTADQVAALRDGRMYVNVHTPDNPDGEARGQLVAAPLS